MSDWLKHEGLFLLRTVTTLVNSALELKEYYNIYYIKRKTSLIMRNEREGGSDLRGGWGLLKDE